jgi:6-phosphogluconate dehydrogenase
LALLKKASSDMHWNLNLAEVIRIWQGGCIIRAKMLSSIRLPRKIDLALSELVALGLTASIPLLAFCAAVGVKVTQKSEKFPANLIQGMRDYFGSHGYRRTDREGTFHTQWQ